jgi:hypothetical protein
LSETSGDLADVLEQPATVPAISKASKPAWNLWFFIFPLSMEAMIDSSFPAPACSELRE